MSSDELLLTATFNLKKGIEYAVHQIRSKRVDPDTKLSWMRSLTRQVEALVKVAEALNNIGSKSATGGDLATFLSSLEREIPAQSQTSPSMSPAARECRTAIRRASVGITGMSGVRRAAVRATN